MRPGSAAEGSRGGGASGVTLAGVEDGEDLDRLGDAVD